MQKFDIYKIINKEPLKYKYITTVFYSEKYTSREVEISLINHDGFDSDIIAIRR